MRTRGASWEVSGACSPNLTLVGALVLWWEWELWCSQVGALVLWWEEEKWSPGRREGYCHFTSRKGASEQCGLCLFIPTFYNDTTLLCCTFNHTAMVGFYWGGGFKQRPGSTGYVRLGCKPCKPSKPCKAREIRLELRWPLRHKPEYKRNTLTKLVRCNGKSKFINSWKINVLLLLAL